MPSALLTAALALALTACASQVGDACEQNTDCGTDLSCDLSQPEGYCTAGPCRPNECPDEAACIEFSDSSSFCMLRCDDKSDCRDGYECVTTFGDVAFCNATQPPLPPRGAQTR